MRSGMSNGIKYVLAGIVIFLMSGAVQAQPRPDDAPRLSDFTGTWQNVKIRETQVVSLSVERLTDTRVIVHVYGLYRGRSVQFGTSDGILFTSTFPRERGQDDAAILVRVDREYVRGNVLLRFNGRGEIVAHALLRFQDERGDVYSVERFAPAEHSIDDDYPRYPRHRRQSRCCDRDRD